MSVTLARLPRTLACLGLAAIAAPLSLYGHDTGQITGLVGLAFAVVFLVMPSLDLAGVDVSVPKPKARRKGGRDRQFDPAWEAVARHRAQQRAKNAARARQTYRIR
jgi:hypothetical protein